MRTKRIGAYEFGHGRWAYDGPASVRRYEWDVVERHADGSVTVVDVPEPPREDWLTGLPPLPLAAPTVRPAEHEMRYVRGPLNRRYRCITCPWEGPVPVEHEGFPEQRTPAATATLHSGGIRTGHRGSNDDSESS